jgi:type IV pilus assembly protein PilQ
MNPVLNLKRLVLAVLMLAALWMSASRAEEEKNAITGMEVFKVEEGLLLQLAVQPPIRYYHLIAPTASLLNAPPRVAFDLTEIDNGLGENRQIFREGDLASADVRQSGQKTRVILNLARPHNVITEWQNSFDFWLRLIPQAPVPSSEPHDIHDIAFQRGDKGKGRITVDLSDADVGVEIFRHGQALQVEFQETAVPERLRRRLDVRDSSTLVDAIKTEHKHGKTRLTITSHGVWEYDAYQTEAQLIVEIHPASADRV